MSVRLLLERAQRIYRTEGFKPLLRQGLRFVVQRFITCETYYVYRYDVSKVADIDIDEITPGIEGFNERMVHSNREADELELQGFEFRSSTIYSRRALDKGAIAHCMSAGQELAAVGWIAMTEEARVALREPPYKVDFAEGEACITAVWTNPKYRRMGLLYYGGVVRDRFLGDKGIKTRRSMVPKDNIPSVRGAAKYGTELYAEVRYVRILWWKSWKETPVSVVTEEGGGQPDGDYS